MTDNHLSLKDFHPNNIRSYVEKPSKNFSRQKNYAVIKGVIEENDRMQTAVHDTVKKNSGNVADILAHFAKYKLDQGGEKQIEGYLGKQWMSKIYGEKLIEKIRMMDSIKRLNRARGNTKFENFYLT